MLYSNINMYCTDSYSTENGSFQQPFDYEGFNYEDLYTQTPQFSTRHHPYNTFNKFNDNNLIRQLEEGYQNNSLYEFPELSEQCLIILLLVVLVIMCALIYNSVKKTNDAIVELLKLLINKDAQV